MAPVDQPRHFATRAAWRAWLGRNHTRTSEIWLLYYKKHTGVRSLSYEEAVEEALCFGWIDGKVRRVDDATFKQRFTPRSDRSVWSEPNRRRAERLMRSGLMTAAGRAKIEAARRTGAWRRATRPSRSPTLPPDLRQALVGRATAWRHFREFAPSYRTLFIHWVTSAKRPETRARRIARVVTMAAANQKPGLM